MEREKHLFEELCARGKAYRKRRMAAGEKSSAYLSGRAVKVCKGQMSGKKKKKKKKKTNEGEGSDARNKASMMFDKMKVGNIIKTSKGEFKKIDDKHFEKVGKPGRKFTFKQMTFIKENEDAAMKKSALGMAMYEEDMTINEVLALEIDENITEAKFKGKTVKLNKPMRGDSKKFKVYVANGKNKDGSIKVKKVNFGHGGTSAKKRGEKTLKIRKSNPKARAAFRARHKCDNPGPKTMARYWSCKKW